MRYAGSRGLGFILVALSTFVVLTALSACAAPSSPESVRCEQLGNLKLDHVTIVSVRAASAGRYFQWRTALIGIPFFKVPASCRITAVSAPSRDSRINIEAWLPLTGWNGRFQGIGNGGFGGSIDRMSLALALQKGYAAASTDTGHEANDQDGSWALGHIEKIRDYGYRAIHETAVLGKDLVLAFYGRAPKFSYFDSGSNGGRQALMEAQRFPTDYDGLLAGCPALDPTDNLPAWGWVQQGLAQTAGAHIPPAKLRAIAEAVNTTCDAQDGVRDGVIDDPRNCRFDPATLQCSRGSDSDHCLTGSQVQALRGIYSGPPAALGGSGQPGFEPGGELGSTGWEDWILGSRPSKSIQYRYVLEFYRYLVYDDPKWSLDRFQFEHDRDAMKRRLGAILDATNPDLSAFRARGGKLILYHGWSDAAIPGQSSVNYYQSVVEKMGPKSVTEFARLYMVPGMQHCGGGDGPSVFGQLGPGPGDAEHDVGKALERWVEGGVAPDAIIAAKYKTGANPASGVARTRPLCAYPKTAQWKGSGSTDDDANFVCK